MTECRKFLVSGRVQGVFFRASTQKQARSLGLTGHAINLPDGRVEVLACGDAGALDQIEQWLWQGSPAASVSDVSAEPAEPDPRPERFTTG
ncbi:MAG: acylphosphatase [Xanthomonadales bacterium]|nr:acylphosphatase [Xanthomonadales bacterium]